MIKDAFLWGVVLWLVGYVLGIMLFAVVPVGMLGWVLTPIGTALIVWVLWKKIKSKSINYYLVLSVVWVIIAVVFDYIFLVKLFNPEDGYYKFDIYLYYSLTFLLPLLVGWYKTKRLGR